MSVVAASAAPASSAAAAATAPLPIPASAAVLPCNCGWTKEELLQLLKDYNNARLARGDPAVVTDIFNQTFIPGTEADPKCKKNFPIAQHLMQIERAALNWVARRAAKNPPANKSSSGSSGTKSSTFSFSWLSSALWAAFRSKPSTRLPDGGSGSRTSGRSPVAPPVTRQTRPAANTGTGNGNKKQKRL